MRSFGIETTLVSIAASLALLLGGCKLVTDVQPPPPVSSTGHPLINEVFVLPASNQNHFNWIEVYNPTDKEFSLRGWTLSFYAQGQIVVLDTAQQQQVLRFEIVDRPFEVPFRGLGLANATLRAYNFLTIVDNESRLLNYTAYGPGNGLVISRPNFLWIDTLSHQVTPDSSVIDSFRVSILQYVLRPTDQLVLKDSSGTVMDVVRYGNYQWPDSLGVDPYPGNRSMGMIPEYQSIARYATVGGAYWTGNTASDFYITGIQEPQTRPIPQWLSQAYK
jgi:Lamin Tail Domain